MSGFAAALFGGAVFVTVYTFNERLAWIVYSLCIFISSFSLEEPLEGNGLGAILNWMFMIKTPLLAISILLLSYLHFGLGVISHQSLWIAYIVLSLMTAWFIEDLPSPVAGRGLFMASYVVTICLTIYFHLYVHFL